MSDTLNPTRDDFSALLDEQLSGRDFGEGQVVHGRVVGIEKDIVIIDVGLKTEGRIAMREFGQGDDGALPKVGDNVEVYLERVENALGEAVISRDKARREEAWTRLEVVFAEGQPVNGAIVGRVKGGFTVDLGGASALLPGSQVDIRPVRDVGPLMGKEQPCAILKMDRPRGNIVVSRRAILEEARAEQRTELVGQLQEGEVREGVVKNITDYGAFVDLGGIDGLLHVTDMSWKRVSHLSQVLAVGDTVKVQIVKINPDTQRISLGMKQLQSDPWDGVEAKYPVGAKYTGRITNITDYGAFVELEAGVEGLVHVSEMSWTKKNVHPGKIVSTSQEVEVVVLDVDPSKRRVSLGLKQAMANPWDAFLETHPVGSTVEGEVKTPARARCARCRRALLCARRGKDRLHVVHPHVAVAIEVAVAGVPEAVAIGIGLRGVRHLEAVVVGIEHPIVCPGMGRAVHRPGTGARRRRGLGGRRRDRHRA